MTQGKMMGRAQVWGSRCRCYDCGDGGRTRHQQRRREDREWRRDQGEPSDVQHAAAGESALHDAGDVAG